MGSLCMCCLQPTTQLSNICRDRSSRCGLEMLLPLLCFAWSHVTHTYTTWVMHCGTCSWFPTCSTATMCVAHAPSVVTDAHIWVTSAMVWSLMQSYGSLQIDGLFLMMGRGLDRLQQVPAGNVIAMGGLGTAILKSATISSTPACRPLAPMLFQVGSKCP